MRQQRFMYLADYGNSHVVVLDRKTLKVLYQFGTCGAPKPGHFQGPHHIAVDSKGNLYVAEVSPGNRAQRFVYKGLAATLSARRPDARAAGTGSDQYGTGAGAERASRLRATRSSARQLPAVDQHDGEPVSRDAQLAAPR